jgi:5-methylcytosine-specific restriction enzyme A
MPYAARRPCNHPGCGEVLPYGESYCARHKRDRTRQDEERRGTANERGYTGAWQKARAAFLRAHPLCVQHEERGELVPATVVDHIVPHKGDRALFWDRTNWQSLCKPCHDAKTAREDGGFGR